MASGRLKGLLIQDREDAAKAAGRLSKSEREKATREAGKRTNDAIWDAIYWARRVGFTADQEAFAAMSALMLRGLRGPGNVTRQMVLDRCCAQHPELFDGLGGEQA